jgi:hypothetical protein
MLKDQNIDLMTSMVDKLEKCTDTMPHPPKPGFKRNITEKVWAVFKVVTTNRKASAYPQ